ncbi:major facilitator superfamily transporter [Colletotrichum truncatum]|uniref:Major facilitator superfamily transporter n=1 Tax=Colletotrichum truncatum TaxID=5467 RepID=A0ACC3YK80_COLTU|nr:major facilitator superfamily transporter [Colletotrichum truncatum]KAF6784317.1 major facilitator superfamily transporter [Colletotrichum truncatum]
MSRQQHKIEPSLDPAQTPTKSNQDSKLLAPDGEPVSTSYDAESNNNQDAPMKKDIRFWTMFLAIGLCQFLAALDATILSTALPTIMYELNSGELYVWVINSYLLASTAFGPIFGQASNIFGRRILTILAVLLFIVGSAICGSANGTVTLIIGRSIQGIGGGGCVVMPEILICDLVSLRERGMYAGALAASWTIACLAAPIIGAVLAERATWRWIFYMNIPISAVVLVPVVLLKQRYPHQGTFFHRLRRIDWLGNAILIMAVASLLLSLTWAGTKNAWSSWRTIVPLVAGILGLAGFVYFESLSWLAEPTMPLRLFQNQTSATIYLTSFLHGMLLFWVGYFLPVYFQAVQNASPMRSATLILPVLTVGAPAGLLAGVLTTVTGSYRPWHFVGWAITAVALGLFTLLDADSSLGYSVGFQVLFGFGFGVLFTTFLPALLAGLSDKDVAVATATWIFIRNLGSIWGIAIPAAVFNTRADQMAQVFPDESLRTLLLKGGAYEHATKAFLDLFRKTPEVYDVIVDLYVKSLKLVWQVAIGFAVLGFLLSFLVQNLELRKTNDTEFGLGPTSKPSNIV